MQIVQNLSQGILYQTTQRSGIFTVDTKTYKLSCTSIALIAAAITYGAGSVYGLLSAKQCNIAYGTIGVLWWFASIHTDNDWNIFSGKKTKNMYFRLIQRTKKRKIDIIGVPKIFKPVVVYSGIGLGVASVLIGCSYAFGAGIQYFGGSVAGLI